MIKIRFEGRGDDTFGEVEHFKDDYDNCASGDPIEYLVLDPDTGRGLIVTWHFGPGNSDSWMIGVANYDPERADVDFPRWPMRIEAQDYRNGFNPSLVIEAPDSVTAWRLAPHHARAWPAPRNTPPTRLGSPRSGWRSSAVADDRASRQ